MYYPKNDSDHLKCQTFNNLKLDQKEAVLNAKSKWSIITDLEIQLNSLKATKGVVCLPSSVACKWYSMYKTGGLNGSNIGLLKEMLSIT